MEYRMKIEQTYLGIPIQAEQSEETLEIFAGEEKIYEFRVPVCKDARKEKYDYYSYLKVTEYEGKELTFKGNFDEIFFENLIQSDSNAQEPLKRPLMHMTAERGWINDPNGLVYYDGTFHLFFQHNPMNTQWQNMSWGHCVSRDLLHFTQVDNALYPDEHGTEFSGCGLVNERGLLGLPKDALLFYYTAAGDANEWSKEKWFTQRIAYSLDGGNTLVKMPEAAIDIIEKDTRDPKIFWHEESNAYCMVLWIQGNEFAFLRSENLKDWEMTEKLIFKEAWECPDLFRLDCEGEEIWVFTSADGFYYLGQFDGYHFKTDFVQKKAYLSKLPYAAQSYSGVKDRVISVPWLRTHNEGKLYTGMMGLPRELTLVKRGEEKVLAMMPVREYETAKQKMRTFSMEAGEFCTEITEDVVTEIELHPRDTEHVTIHFFGEELTIQGNVMSYKEEKTEFPEKIEELHIIIDRDVVEIHANNATANAYYETNSHKLTGSICIKGCEGEGKLYRWQP